MLAPAPALLALLLAAQVQPKVVEGDARFGPDDRPAAGMTIRVGVPSVDQGVETVVDARGRFRFEVRTGWLIPQPDGNTAECEAVAEPPGRWRIESSLTDGSTRDEKQWRREVDRALARHARGTWRDGRLVVACPEPGEADVLVVGRDGKPLPDREVVVEPGIGLSPSGRTYFTVRFHGRTDAASRFRIRWFEGALQFRVTVPGEGTASTPVFDVAAGKTVAVSTLPLVRLGSISGRLAPALVQPGAEIRHHQMFGDRRWPCDAEGRFELRDLLPGHYVLRAAQTKPGASAVQVIVWLAPGAKVEGLVIEANPPPTPEQAERLKQSQQQMLSRFNPRIIGGNPDNKQELWVEGTVRDTKGQAVAGATVYARTTYDGGMRMLGDVAEATTDAQGHYAIRGVAGRANSMVLVAHAPGRPPAVVNAPSRVRPSEGGQSQNPPVDLDPPTPQDLTLPDPGAGGSVRFAVGQIPQARLAIPIRLQPQGPADVNYGSFAVHTLGESAAELQALLNPAGKIERGEPRFADLMPGLYSFGVLRPISGLVVASGRETRVPEVPGSTGQTVRFRVLRPDGKPVRNQPIGLQFLQQKNGYSGHRIQIDDDGYGQHKFDEPGLWVVSARFRDVPTNVYWIQDPPYDEAQAQIAVAPGLASGPNPVETIRLATVPRVRETGSLLVRLVDADGRPAQGVVEFEDTVGATDAAGEVRFAGVSPEPRRIPRRVSAWADGPTPPAVSSAGPMPPDEALRGRFAVVAGSEVQVTAGQEQVVTLAARAVGYVRARIRPAEGRKAIDYRVYPFGSAPDWRFDPASGEFLAGPCPAGPVTLDLSESSPDGRKTTPRGRTVVEVVAGEVAHADLVPREIGPDDPQSKARMTQQRAPKLVPMRVVLPDGRTPAYAAQALLFVPFSPHPISNGISDGSGRLTWRGAGWSSSGKDDPQDGRVDRPMAVVSLPGQFGATIVPLEEGVEQRVVLPPEINAEGTVRVGGTPAGARSLIRVVAAHQGRGNLDEFLGRTTLAGPDGRFTLAGLTPGRYVIQAVCDEVLTSEAVEVTVAPGQPVPPVALAIPPPGPAVTLDLRKRTGLVLADTLFRVVPPPGPLAELWTRLPLRSDAKGHLTLRGLPVGRHTIAIAETGDTAEFTVDPASTGLQQILIHRASP